MPEKRLAKTRAVYPKSVWCAKCGASVICVSAVPPPNLTKEGRIAEMEKDLKK